MIKYIVALVVIVLIVVLSKSRINSKEKELLKADALNVFSKYLPDAKTWILENAGQLISGQAKFQNVLSNLTGEVPSTVKVLLGDDLIKKLLQDYYECVKETDEFKEIEKKDVE